VTKRWKTPERGLLKTHDRPAIFWLLLAATICVDAVASSWVEAGYSFDFGFVAFDALVLSQVSVVSIWSSLNSENSLWTRCSPFLVVVLATLVYGLFGDSHFIGKVGEVPSLRMGLVLVHQGLHAALLVAMLWLLKRTALWKRRYDSTAEWQFSTADLLVVITVAAVLGAGIRFTKMVDDGDWADIAHIGSSAVVATSGVLIWSLWRAPWVLRASGVMGVAIGLVAVAMLAEWLVHPGPQRRFPTPAFPVILATHLDTSAHAHDVACLGTAFTAYAFGNQCALSKSQTMPSALIPARAAFGAIEAVGDPALGSPYQPLMTCRLLRILSACIFERQMLGFFTVGINTENFH
jgi:hypothetical protein